MKRFLLFCLLTISCFAQRTVTYDPTSGKLMQGNVHSHSISTLVSDIDITGYQPDPNNYDAFPGMVKLSNNTLLLVYRNGTNHLGYGTLQKRTSTDFGATWSINSTVLSDSLDLRDPSITLLQSGKIVLSFFKFDPTTGGTTGPWISISSDSGVIWGTPYNIGTLVGSPIVSAVSSPAVETAPNQLVLAWYGSVVGLTPPYPSDVFVSRSSDGGLTWICDSGIFTGDSLNEPNLVYLGGSTILMTIRNDTTHKIQKSLSTNLGASWTTPVDIWDGTGSPRLFRSSSGLLYCFYRANLEPWTPLSNAFLWRVSANEGGSWSFERGGDWQGLKHDFDYASAVSLSSGTIGIVYALHNVVGPPCSLYFKVIKDEYLQPAAQLSTLRINDGNLTLNNSVARLYDSYGGVTISPNAGRLLFQPSVGFSLQAPEAFYGPSLGYKTGTFSILEPNNNYGLNLGVSLTGDTWMQVQRFDGAATTYKLLLNPNGGNASLGVLNPSGSKFQLGYPDHDEAGLDLRAGDTAKGVVIRGRPTSNGEGYLQFFNYDKTVLQGAIYGITNSLRFSDKDGNDVAVFKDKKMGLGIIEPRIRLDLSEITFYGAPTLGVASGGFSLSEPSGSYGLISGVYFDGTVWMQSQNLNGSSAAYSLALQPSGGNLLLGTMVDNGSRLNVAVPDVGKPGATLRAGSLSDALKVVGRSDHQGAVTFVKNDEATVEGSISGAVNTISLNDSLGNPRVSVSDDKTTVNGILKVNALSTAEAVKVIGRSGGNQEGYIQFYKNNGTDVEGSLWGDTSGLHLDGDTWITGTLVADRFSSPAGGSIVLPSSPVNGYFVQTDGSGNWSYAPNTVSGSSSGITQISGDTTTIQTIVGASGIAVNSDLAGTHTISPVYGTSSGTVVQGNDSRFHSAVTLGTANGLSLSGQQISLGTANSGVSGALSSSDWTTFNAKQSVQTDLTAIIGLGSSGRAYKISSGNWGLDTTNYATVASLGDSAGKNVGTTAGTVAAGDDSRFLTTNRKIRRTVSNPDYMTVNDDIVFVQQDSGITYTYLPPPLNGRTITIKRDFGSSGYDTRIMPNASEQIEYYSGAYSIGGTQYVSVTLVSDGTDWFVIR